MQFRNFLQIVLSIILSNNSVTGGIDHPSLFLLCPSGLLQDIANSWCLRVLVPKTVQSHVAVLCGGSEELQNYSLGAALSTSWSGVSE